MTLIMRGVNLVDSLLNVELRVGTLEKALNRILQGKEMAQRDIQKMRHQTFSEMKEKYPVDHPFPISFILISITKL